MPFGVREGIDSRWATEVGQLAAGSEWRARLYLWMREKIIVDTKPRLSRAAQLKRSQKNQIETTHHGSSGITGV